MPWILAATALAGVGSAIIGGGAAKSAADQQSQAAVTAAQIQADAAKRAADLQLGFFNTVRGDLSPYRDVGTSALPGYYALLGLPPPRAAAPTSQPVTPPTGGQAGGNSGVIDLTRQPDGSYGLGTPPAAAPVSPYKAGDLNWGQVLKDRPDVLAEYNKILPTVDWHSPWAAQHGFTQGGGPEQFAQWWYENNKPASDTYAAPTWTQEQIDQAYPQTAAPAGSGTSGTPGTSLAIPGSAPIDASGIQSYLESLPGYQFTKSQGLQAVTNALGARGLSGGTAAVPGAPQSLSGAFGKGISRFVTGLADQTYGEQLDRIARAVGVGQAAANQTGAFGQAATTGAANSLVGGAQASASGVTGAANAGAAGTIGAANAATGGLNNVANSYLTSRVLSMYNPSTSV